MAEYRNEMLEELVGKPVIVSHLMIPKLGKTGEEHEVNMQKVIDDPSFAQHSSPLSAFLASYELMSYDQLGVTLRKLKGEASDFFMPWGAVIHIEAGFEEHTKYMDEYSA